MFDSLLLPDEDGGGRKPRRSRILPHAFRSLSERVLSVFMPMPIPSPAVGVGEVGRESQGWAGRELGPAGPSELYAGGASPDDMIGSEEPVSREAAVAAAATLKVGNMIR
jgi:hypothetical protein